MQAELGVPLRTGRFRCHAKLILTHSGKITLGNAGELSLRSISKDPENRIIYFVFSYDSELVNVPFLVHHYDPLQGRIVLKSNRITSRRLGSC